MALPFDDKGKIFTNVIPKRPIAATIQTQSQLIQGQIHVRPSERLKDEINRSDQFIAVTNAVIFDSSGQILYKCNFLTLNRDHILWLIPDEDIILPSGGTEE
jgi:hypothetical protein